MEDVMISETGENIGVELFRPVGEVLLPSDILGLNDLRPERLSENDWKIIETFKGLHKFNIKEDINKAVEIFSTYKNQHLFRMSNADAVVKSYFCNPDIAYQVEWKKRINQAEPDCDVEKLKSPFDFLMGLHLRSMYNIFVERGFADHPEAQELAEAAIARGVTIPSFAMPDPVAAPRF